MLFETLTTSGHEQVVFCNNPDVGLKAIIAVHNTVLGPALGGVRMRQYANEGDAVRDVLRLSRTMTYKNALAGLNVGGGKAVILGDPKVDKTEALFRAFGRAVDALGGRYITAEDVGTDVNDMELVYLETEYVTGVHQVHGGSGDPAPFTAYGTLQALMASLQRKLGHEEIGKASIAVQGLGHIGMELVKLLRERGARLYVTDLDPARVQHAVAEFGVEAVGVDEIYDVPADVFAPCAMEGALTMETIERLKAKIVCGSANNQLANHAVGDELHKRGILFAPDYAVNAGGVMNVSLEIDGYNRERAMRLIRSIYHNVTRIFDVSEREAISPQYAADRIAEARLASIGKLKLPMGRATPRMGHLRGEQH
ncbi:Glu/Leu/Phe/Val dehydrogenase dimerization region [Pseudoxanthomonas suwonensis 11-1]|uniref:Glu/Leu/Phe/Val dehydrogenase dimerization region n=1 Tax=Pseudoxanthomonas suwonensis (strain 11-1) TaxID=743721 RepID=E6WTH6_PSEUU|nr:Glu/Leu/Phe/Val dehydrogenase [Pseudoxanthomonas suwonensis]ADV27475.1 Glu/Leu/Phe/Val dehydrogenase dimerization region [Pseudoxanthomonas suwonensis 11-1]